MKSLPYEDMGYVPSVAVGFVMVFITMVCWGSWANAMRKCGSWRFEGFYWGYSLSTVISTLLLVMILGGISSFGWAPSNFFQSFQSAEFSALAWAIFAGFVWGMGNLLLIIAVDLVGFSVAFPLGGGLALVLGTFLAYITNPQATHRPSFLFIGLALVTLAILVNGLAYRAKEDGKVNKYFKKGIFVALVCGILIGLFPFPFNFAFKGGLNGYGASLLMTIGGFVSTLILLPILMRKPLKSSFPPVSFLELLKAKHTWYLWAFLSGFVWSIGTIFNLVVGSQPDFSVAIAYTLGQCATLVAALWGVFVWKEFEGAPFQSRLYLGVMFLLFLMGIISLANAI